MATSRTTTDRYIGAGRSAASLRLRKSDEDAAYVVSSAPVDDLGILKIDGADDDENDEGGDNRQIVFLGVRHCAGQFRIILRAVSGDSGNPVGHVFISYARMDAEHVDMLQEVLEAAGIPVWRDTSSLRPGDNWPERVRTAIAHEALFCLICFSSASIARGKGYQNEEIVQAIDKMRLRHSSETWLIPVRFDECEIPNISLGAGRTLASIHSADLFGSQYDEEATKLIWVISRRLTVPAKHGKTSLGAVSSRGLILPQRRILRSTFTLLTGFFAAGAAFFFGRGQVISGLAACLLTLILVAVRTSTTVINKMYVRFTDIRRAAPRTRITEGDILSPAEIVEALRHLSSTPGGILSLDIADVIEDDPFIKSAWTDVQQDIHQLYQALGPPPMKTLTEVPHA